NCPSLLQRKGPPALWNRVLPDRPRVNLAARRTVKLLPALLARLIDKSCAIRMSGGQVSSCQEHTPVCRRSAWATRGPSITPNCQRLFARSRHTHYTASLPD